MAFELDTSGAIRRPVVYPQLAADYPDVFWSDLTPFEQGYGTAAARELYERLIAEGWASEGANKAVAFRNWSPAALEMIRHRCNFRLKATKLPVGYAAEDGRIFWEEQQRGELSYFSPQRPFLNDQGQVDLAEAGE